MAVPLIPVALKVAQWGAIVAVAWHAGQRFHAKGPRDAWRAQALAARYRRRIRLGASGPGVELDFTNLSLLRIRHICSQQSS